MRKSQAKKLPLAPDSKYNDKLVTRFVNNLMLDGKKSTAITIFYDAIDKVSKTTNEDGYEIWKRALNNVTPGVEVRSRRIGGATFQIPTEVRQDRKVSLSIKWLIRYSRERNGRTMIRSRSPCSSVFYHLPSQKLNFYSWKFIECRLPLPS